MTEFVRRSYNDAAATYLRARRDDQHDLPQLDRLISHLQPGDRVLDVGCGPGLPIAAHLVSSGLEVIGIDISEAQIELARRHVPEATFLVRDMCELAEGEFHVAAVIAFYSLFHTPREGHRRLLEILRTFVPTGGRLLCTFGSTEWEGEEPFCGVPMRWSHYGPEASLELVAEAGFEIDWSETVEHRFHGEIERHVVVAATSTAGVAVM